MRATLTGVVNQDASRPPGTRPLAQAGPQEIRLPRGGTLTVDLSVLTADGGPQDLTGWTTILQVKRFANDDPADIAKTATVVGLGLARFAVVPADTRRLEPGRYVYDVWTTDPAANRYQVVPVGVLVLLPTVTLPP